MPEGWRIRKLGEVLDVQNGYAFDSNQFSENEGVPLIRIRDLKNGRKTSLRFVGEFDERFLVSAGNLLIGMDGEFRCYTWRGERALLNQRVCRLVNFSEEIDPEFIAYGIDSHLKKIEDATPFVTVKHLSAKSIKAIEFAYPARAEQRRIVDRIKECLGRVEEIEGLTSDVEVEADHLPQAFRFDLWNECLGRHPLRELGSLVSSAKNGLYKPREHHGTGSILLRMFNINGAQFDTTRLERLMVTEKEAEDYAVRTGDIIVSRVNSRELVGKSTVVTGLNEPAVYEAMLIRLRIDATKARPDVLAWLMNAPQFLYGLRTRAKHAIGQSSINQRDLLSSCLPLPPLDEQQRLADRYADLGELAASLLEETGARRQARDGLRAAILRKALAREL